MCHHLVQDLFSEPGPVCDTADGGSLSSNGESESQTGIENTRLRTGDAPQRRVAPRLSLGATHLCTTFFPNFNNSNIVNHIPIKMGIKWSHHFV